jgi:hypothetical protein
MKLLREIITRQKKMSMTRGGSVALRRKLKQPSSIGCQRPSELNRDAVAWSHNHGAQSRAQVIDEHDERDQNQHDGGRFLILKSAEAGVH